MKKFRFANGELSQNGKGLIMGILNVTPDSFSDGGEFFNAEDAISHAKKMLSDGADIIDVGAMSTRPGSVPVPYREEIRRLEPVLKELCVIDNAVISVDTVNPETADFALSMGVNIINDVSGCFNIDMASVVKKYRAGWIMTHTANVPSGSVVDYPDGVVNAVKDFFDSFLCDCEKYGIGNEYICLDPGFGFAKTTDDNIELLKNLEKIIRPDVAFLAALSRKRFIGEITDTPEADERLAGTLTADIIALMKGSDLLRVHDVKETRQAIAIYNSIYNKGTTIYG
ncbi:MAG: dihydropteroate synthase [Clostridia bacterium]|nr:dihydropteroate synthase [Clostridia bacterium]